MKCELLPASWRCVVQCSGDCGENYIEGPVAPTPIAAVNAAAVVAQGAEHNWTVRSDGEIFCPLCKHGSFEAFMDRQQRRDDARRIRVDA